MAGQRTGLPRYRDDGRVAIDNNSAERAIRLRVLERKTWLFAGSDAGGGRAAAIASLLEAAKLNGIDPAGDTVCLAPPATPELIERMLAAGPKYGVRWA